MPSLAETQKILWRLITAPEGVARGLAEMPDRERALPEGLEALVESDARLSAVERLDVYANMYFFRILDCFKEDFPAVRAAVGEAHFHNFVTFYLNEHPSTHPSLRFVARHFATWLETHEPAWRWPWLPDLARLEWAILDAFDAPDADPLPAERLQSLPPEDWAAARFRFSPSLQVVRAAAGVHAVWAAANAGEEVAAPEPAATTIRVWRRGLGVLHRAIDATEAAALDAVIAGRDFAGVCEAVAHVAPDGEAAIAAAAVLQRWFADALVVGLDTPSA